MRLYIANVDVDVTGLPPNTVPMQAGLHIDVRPPRPPTLDAPIPTHETFYAAVSSGAPPDLPLPTLNKFKQAQAAYTALEANNARIARPGDDVVVVPLGTSSALPNKYRNGEFLLIMCSSTHALTRLPCLSRGRSLVHPDTDPRPRKRAA